MKELDLRLRKAQADDCMLLFEWANDPNVKKASFCTNKISWKAHKIWFADMLENNKSCIFIVMLSNLSIGQVRISVDSNAVAELNYSIADQYRGLGFGKKIISMSEAEFIKEFSDVKKFVARVKPNNFASKRCLENNGYIESKVTSDMIIYEKPAS